MRDANAWNAVQFRPDERGGHVESYFMKLNDAEGRRALWLKATIRAPLGEPPVAEAWAIAFDRRGGHVAVKEIVPYPEASFSHERLDCRVAGSTFEPTRTKGSLGCGGRSIAWDLDFAGTLAPFVPLPERAYDPRVPTSKAVTPHPDLKFTGSYTVNGERVDVTGWAGMQGHNWGRRHAFFYGWGHCNVWDDADELVLEGMTAQVKVGPLKTPRITLVAVLHRGVRYEFTTARAILAARGAMTHRSWIFHAENDLATVTGKLFADTEDFVGLRYDNPSGPPTFCLNSKIARGDLRFEVKGRAPLVAHTHAAALEIGTMATDHGVQILV